MIAASLKPLTGGRGGKVAASGSCPVGRPVLGRILDQDTGQQPLVDLGVGAHDRRGLSCAACAGSGRRGRRRPCWPSGCTASAHRRLVIPVGAHALVGYVECAGTLGVLGGHADRAGLVWQRCAWMQPDGHHHRARRVGVVGTLHQGFDDVVPVATLPLAPMRRYWRRPVPDERVVHCHQTRRSAAARPQRRAPKMLWRCRPGAVDDEHETRGGTRPVEHRLAERRAPRLRGADAEFECRRVCRRRGRAGGATNSIRLERCPERRSAPRDSRTSHGNGPPR